MAQRQADSPAIPADGASPPWRAGAHPARLAGAAVVVLVALALLLGATDTVIDPPGATARAQQPTDDEGNGATAVPGDAGVLVSYLPTACVAIAHPADWSRVLGSQAARPPAPFAGAVAWLRFEPDSADDSKGRRMTLVHLQSRGDAIDTAVADVQMQLDRAGQSPIRQPNDLRLDDRVFGLIQAQSPARRILVTIHGRATMLLIHEGEATGQAAVAARSAFLRALRWFDPIDDSFAGLWPLPGFAGHIPAPPNYVGAVTPADGTSPTEIGAASLALSQPGPAGARWLLRTLPLPIIETPATLDDAMAPVERALSRRMGFVRERGEPLGAGFLSIGHVSGNGDDDPAATTPLMVWYGLTEQRPVRLLVLVAQGPAVSVRTWKADLSRSVRAIRWAAGGADALPRDLSLELSAELLDTSGDSAAELVRFGVRFHDGAGEAVTFTDRPYRLRAELRNGDTVVHRFASELRGSTSGAFLLGEVDDWLAIDAAHALVMSWSTLEDFAAAAGEDGLDLLKLQVTVAFETTDDGGAVSHVVSRAPISALLGSPD